MIDEGVTIPLPDGRRIRVIVLEVRGATVRLGFEAEIDIEIHRDEVMQAIDRERAEGRTPAPGIPALRRSPDGTFVPADQRQEEQREEKRKAMEARQRESWRFGGGANIGVIPKGTENP
jgi:carbon storage regulator CsrA